MDNAVAKARNAYSQISSYANLSYASYESIGSSSKSNNSSSSSNNSGNTTKKYAGSATATLKLDNGTVIVKQAQTSRQYSTSSEATTAAREAALNSIKNSKDYIYITNYLV